MARIKPIRGHFNKSRVAATLISRGMKPQKAITQAKSYQLKSHNKMKRHLTMQKKAQVDAARNTTAQRLATIGKVAYIGRLFQNNVTRHLGNLASYGRNYRG